MTVTKEELLKAVEAKELEDIASIIYDSNDEDYTTNAIDNIEQELNTIIEYINRFYV